MTEQANYKESQIKHQKRKTYETDKTTIAKLDCIMDVAVCVIDGERPEARDLSQLLVLPKAVAVPPPMLSGSSDSEDV